MERPHGGGKRIRLCAGAALAVSVMFWPARLTTLRWWLSPTVAASVGLTRAQREAIDRLYMDRLAGRRRCVERLVAASVRVDELLRDGADNDESMNQTQAAALAAEDERAWVRGLGVDIAALLSQEQQERLAASTVGPIVD
jgi:hypothetical protein